MTPPRYYINDVRTAWTRLLDDLDAAHGAVTIYKKAAGRPTVRTEAPYVECLSPDLYTRYLETLDEPEPDVIHLPRNRETNTVDWTDADTNDDVTAAEIDVRAIRRDWAHAHHRVAKGLHLFVLHKYPIPGRRVAVFTPLDFAERGRAALTG